MSKRGAINDRLSEMRNSLPVLQDTCGDGRRVHHHDQSTVLDAKTIEEGRG